MTCVMTESMCSASVDASLW